MSVPELTETYIPPPFPDEHLQLSNLIPESVFELLTLISNTAPFPLPRTISVNVTSVVSSIPLPTFRSALSAVVVAALDENRICVSERVLDEVRVKRYCPVAICAAMLIVKLFNVTALDAEVSANELDVASELPTVNVTAA